LPPRWALLTYRSRGAERKRRRPSAAAAAAAVAAARSGQAIVPRQVLPAIAEADISVHEHAGVDSLGRASQTTVVEPQQQPSALDYDAMFSPSNAEYATYRQSWHHIQKEYSAPATPRSLSAACSPQQQTLSVSESMLAFDLDGAILPVPGAGVPVHDAGFATVHCAGTVAGIVALGVWAMHTFPSASRPIGRRFLLQSRTLQPMYAAR